MLKLRNLKASFAVAALLFSWQTVSAQTISPTPEIFRNAKPTSTPASKLSAVFAANIDRQKEISTEDRRAAYAKLLEGQRYYWKSTKDRAAQGSGELAKRAFQKAVELNPNLSEGYAALAELALTTAPGDIEECIELSKLAVKVQPESFGGHRLLAFAYTIKTGLNRTPNLAKPLVEKAIAEWKEVTKLDPRFAEAWAFLSELYDKTNRTGEQIEALRRWQASAPPIETRYYHSIMGDQASLAPEAVSLKLGAALIKADRSNEAVEVLAEALADDPDNAEAVDLLKQAVENGGGKVSSEILRSLQQAVFANPKNTSLIELTAQAQARGGQFDEAVKFLRAAIENFQATDKNSASALQISLGDIFSDANRYDEAVAAYEQGLKIQGIDKDSINTEEAREVAAQIFEKIIRAYKNAGKIAEAKAAIRRAGTLFGDDDLFSGKQIISLLRETGNKREALEHVRTLRLKMKGDYSLLRLEASLLAELGKVDEAVSLIKTLLVSKLVKNSSTGKIVRSENPATSSNLPPSPYYDDFTNYIFISSLYNQAGRGADAVEAARKAFAVAESEEKKQIADLSLATAEQTSGNFRSAEEILRELIKKTPGNPVALNNLGYFLLERSEKYDEALNLIRQAVNIDPTNSSYLDSLGWAYFKIGKLGEAELYLKEAIRNNMASATVYEHLGDVYQKQEKLDLAKAAWQKAMTISPNSETANRLREKISSRSVK